MNHHKFFTIRHSLFTIPSFGFTLIELLVVLVLTSLFIGSGAAAYRKFNAQQIVVTSGKELLVNLRQAQAKVNSGIKTASGCTNTQLTGYRVQAVAGSLGQYTVAEMYATNCASGGTSNAGVIKTVVLPTGVAFQSAFTVTFLGLSGGATLSAASPLTVRICNSACGATSTKYSVILNTAGLIQDNGAQ